MFYPVEEEKIETEIKFPYLITGLSVWMKLYEKKKLSKIYSHEQKIGKDVCTCIYVCVDI